jgi:hypothetical protein
VLARIVSLQLTAGNRNRSELRLRRFVPYPANVQNGKVAAADGSFDWPFGQHSPVL